LRRSLGNDAASFQLLAEAMTVEVIYVVYVTSLMLTISPLVHILLRKRLSRYFAYFVATSSFVCLNLLGSISPKVLGTEPSLDLHLALLAIAFALFLLYLAIDAVAPRPAAASVAPRLLDSARDNRFALGCYVALLLTISLVGSVAFYLTISPPLLFAFELFGRWDALTTKRVAITLSRPYHWYALAIFEIPLFTVILLNVLRHIQGPRRARWSFVFWLVAPVAAVASVLILQKQNVLYVLASFLLVLMVFRNRLPVWPLTAFAVGGAVAVALLYLVLWGPEGAGGIPASIAHRVFEAAPWSSAAAFALFPAEMPFLQGTSVINFFQMFEYEQVNVALLIYPRVYGDASGQSPLPAVIEMYANHGWPGIGVGIVVAVGFVFGASILSWSKDVWTFSLAIYLAIKAVFIWLVPFWFGALEPTLLVLVLFLFVTFRTVRALTGGSRLP